MSEDKSWEHIDLLSRRQIKEYLQQEFFMRPPSLRDVHYIIWKDRSEKLMKRSEELLKESYAIMEAYSEISKMKDDNPILWTDLFKNNRERFKKNEEAWKLHRKQEQLLETFYKEKLQNGR